MLIKIKNQIQNIKSAISHDYFFSFSFVIIFLAFFVMLIVNIDYQFAGDDFVHIIDRFLRRYSHCSGDFSILCGLNPYHILSSSYGWIYYIFESLRLILFKVHIIEFNEFNYRFFNGIINFFFALILSAQLKKVFNKEQLLVFLILIVFTPMYLSYYRGLGFSMATYLIRMLPFLFTLQYLKTFKNKYLVYFYIFQFILFSSEGTYIYWGATLLFIILYFLKNNNYKIFATIRVIKQNYFTTQLQKRLFWAFSFLNLFIVFFNLFFYKILISQEYTFQGIITHALGIININAIGVRTTSLIDNFIYFYYNTGSLFSVLLITTCILIIHTIWKKEKFSALSIFSFITLLPFVIITLLSFGSRHINWVFLIFPLLLIIADNLGLFLHKINKRSKQSIAILIIFFSILVGSQVVAGTSKNQFGYGVNRPDNGYRTFAYIYRKYFQYYDNLYTDDEYHTTFYIYAGESELMYTGKRSYTLSEKGSYIFSDEGKNMQRIKSIKGNLDKIVDLYLINLKNDNPLNQKIIEKNQLKLFFTINNSKEELFKVYAKEKIIGKIDLPEDRILKTNEYNEVFKEEFNDINMFFQPRIPDEFRNKSFLDYWQFIKKKIFD